MAMPLPPGEERLSIASVRRELIELRRLFKWLDARPGQPALTALTGTDAADYSSYLQREIRSGAGRLGRARRSAGSGGSAMPCRATGCCSTPSTRKGGRTIMRGEDQARTALTGSRRTSSARSSPGQSGSSTISPPISSRQRGNGRNCAPTGLLPRANATRPSCPPWRSSWPGTRKKGGRSRAARTASTTRSWPGCCHAAGTC
jgi:hypothetical protein